VKRFVEGEDRNQVTLLPECLDDYIGEDNAVRVIDVFIEELDLMGLGFEGVAPADTGRPAYHPAVMLKVYVYGYLNRLQSSRRLERETQRNVELMWLTGRLTPDFKTIADFRRDNGVIFGLDLDRCQAEKQLRAIALGAPRANAALRSRRCAVAGNVEALIVGL